MIMDYEIEQGVLNWDGGERVSNRYGAVTLWKTPGEDVSDDAVIKLGKHKILEKRKGKLVAEVIETRDSYHIGDLFRGLFPSTPKVGEVFVLGSGTAFLTEHDTIGIVPDDGRKNDWLDPKILYKLHNQTVILGFVFGKST